MMPRCHHSCTGSGGEARCRVDIEEAVKLDQNQTKETAGVRRPPEAGRQIRDTGGVFHIGVGGQLQVDADPYDGRRNAPAPGRQFDENASQLAAMHQHVIGPLELHALDSQLFERPGHGKAGDEGQACRHRGIRGEATQGGEGQAGTRPGLPGTPPPPPPGRLHVSGEHMHAPVVRGQVGQQTAVGGIALRQEHQRKGTSQVIQSSQHRPRIEGLVIGTVQESNPGK